MVSATQISYGEGNVLSMSTYRAHDFFFFFPPKSVVTLSQITVSFLTPLLESIL